ncbi:hypothetical protein [Parvimonas micra]|uniref:hypothetical protein n=1 Tax=Parvimonas micra TaxID=33033 RepID=UPI0028E79EBD|nr:hypothetical protein [Parvimonas micra]
MESIINEAKEKSANVDSFFELVQKTFIEKVYVYQSEKLWSQDTKKLKIVFNFIREIQISSNEKTA